MIVLLDFSFFKKIFGVKLKPPVYIRYLYTAVHSQKKKKIIC